MSLNWHLPAAILAVSIATITVVAQNDDLLTRAERTNYVETSTHEDVRAFSRALAARSRHIRIETFGASEEGRELPLLVLGDPPAAVPPTGGSRLPVVLAMANIHAGEVEGKEALLHLARRMTTGDLRPLLRSAVWLFAPIYNADGNEKISLDNRSEQNGPIAGVGTRENARGLDLNRDFMKLESAEARALVALMTRWDPDVVIDLHTTNGSYHGYHLTYAPTLNPNADARIVAFTRDRLLPAVSASMDRQGFRTYFYGNFATAEALNTERERFDGSEPGTQVWRTFDHRPRFGNNYIGLRNRIALLSEAYSYLEFPKRVQATEAFVVETMRFVAANADAVRTLVARADADWTGGGTDRQAGVGFEIRPLPSPVDILVGAVRKVANPRSGSEMTAMVETVATPTRMPDYGVFAAARTRPVPYAYVVPPTADRVHDAVARKLKQHGIIVEELTEPARLRGQQFLIDRIDRAERTFQGHRETSLTGHPAGVDAMMPSGSIVVRTAQPLGRLAFYLLEPESDDGLTTWNVLDEALRAGAPHPVLTVRQPVSLPVRPVP